LCGKKSETLHSKPGTAGAVSFRMPSLTDRKKQILLLGDFPFSGFTFALTKHKTMTEQQSSLFSEILDLNWEFEHETDWSKKWELAKSLGLKKQELRENMGHKEYDTFIENGRKMFAPLEDNEEVELED
jgi:hypothetical protein